MTPDFNDTTIPLAFDKKLLDMGVKTYIQWEPKRHPMFLTVGATNSGKSYHLALLMGKISSLFQASIYLCDFKNQDFREFSDCPRHFAYESCTDGLTAFYESFQDRLYGNDTNEDAQRKYLVFDEWSGFTLSRPDKKSQDDVKGKLSTLLMMGRGVQHHVIIGLQRADSHLFPMGGRDQFSAILALGNLSREQKLMLFPDSRENMDAINKQGQGYLSLDGEPLRRVEVPKVTNFQKLHQAIREGLTR